MAIAKKSLPAPAARIVYQAAVAVILLYSCEGWVLPPSSCEQCEKVTYGMCHRLAGMHLKKIKGKWVYPNFAEALKKTNLKPLRHCIQKRRHTVYGTISSRPVLEECKGATRLKGSLLHMYW